MQGWRDELVETIKTQIEREAEEAERRQQRLEAALKVADEAVQLAVGALAFLHDSVKQKKLPGKLQKKKDNARYELYGHTIVVELSRDKAVLEVTCNGGKPREFDFANDRHLAPKDVEEYVGRRAVELARAAQKSNPW